MKLQDKINQTIAVAIGANPTPADVQCFEADVKHCYIRSGKQYGRVIAPNGTRYLVGLWHRPVWKAIKVI